MTIWGSARATGMQELLDDIDAIEQKIDVIDLDQSKDPARVTIRPPSSITPVPLR
jgi:hypothetical protein